MVNDILAGHHARVLAHVEAVLPHADPARVHDPADDLGLMREAMIYAMQGGKGVRGALAFETARLLGVSGETALAVAAAAETFHAYSLVHDDLPAMDDDDLRRGRPTVHVKYGDALAILVGDALQALSFHFLASIDDPAVPPGNALVVLQRLAKVGGHLGMGGGQWMDLSAEGRPPVTVLAHVETVQRLKTGALIEWSATANALLSGAPPAPFETYAEAIGLAFQIQDDLLDVLGTEAEAGKAVGKDAGRGKATFVDLLGVEGARRRAQELVDEATGALEDFGQDAEILRELARFIVTRRS
ncbi:polyprenyl synthetase family protein [Roseisalinus antarcticus]|uniref:polyprenyl synthetase family protein n=1 Tax=Roseisalinus antarcticus TaxID=254357 RepID=UPI0035221863